MNTISKRLYQSVLNSPISNPAKNAKIQSGSKNSCGAQNRTAAKNSIREMNREVAKTDSQGRRVFQASSRTSIVSSTLNYSDALKAQRQKMKEASLSVKTVKYQFKNLSSKIMRSKTSNAARQVVGQAKREVLRLKRERQKGEGDSEEIEAAIAHAKAMERVAKKKVRHLEEEEMVKAAGGFCNERLEEDINESDSKLKEPDDEEAYDEEYDEALKDTITEDAYESTSEYELPDEEVLEMYDYVSRSLEDMSAMFSDIEEMTAEMFDEFAETMKDLMSDMGLDELSEAGGVVKKDMDPADFKMMKIKHRNKEMKDIVKADADYLKTIFDHMAKTQNAGMSAPTGMAPQSMAPVPQASFGMSVPTPTIDISL